MVDFGIHIFCGGMRSEKLQKGLVDSGTLIKDFLRVFTNMSQNLGNLYDFRFNFKTIFLKMLIEVFLD